MLQSRLRLLESEKKEAAIQVLELEKSLALHKEEFRRKLNSSKDEHAEAICKVSAEKMKEINNFFLRIICSAGVREAEDFF